MPVRHGRDSKGNYYRWGNEKKYYYYNEPERKEAKYRAIIQGYAIEKSEERRGKPTELTKSRSTGRMTHLRGIDEDHGRRRKSKTLGRH